MNICSICKGDLYNLGSGHICPGKPSSDVEFLIAKATCEGAEAMRFKVIAVLEEEKAYWDKADSNEANSYSRMLGRLLKQVQEA